jgi:hypothetical protein
MRALYPGFAQKLADLLPRIAANDREVEYINAHALPRGGPTAQGVGNNGAEPAVVLRGAVGRCNAQIGGPLSGAKQKTFAQSELYRF